MSFFVRIFRYQLGARFVISYLRLWFSGQLLLRHISSTLLSNCPQYSPTRDKALAIKRDIVSSKDTWFLNGCASQHFSFLSHSSCDEKTFCHKYEANSVYRQVVPCKLSVKTFYGHKTFLKIFKATRPARWRSG